MDWLVELWAKASGRGSVCDDLRAFNHCSCHGAHMYLSPKGLAASFRFNPSVDTHTDWLTHFSMRFWLWPPPLLWSPVLRLPEQGEEGCRLHVGQLYLRGGGGHASVEHGIKHGAARGQDEFMGRYPLGLSALPDYEPDVAEQLVVEEEGEALLQGALRRLPVVHGLPLQAEDGRGGGPGRAGGWLLHVGQHRCGSGLSRVGCCLLTVMVWR